MGRVSNKVALITGSTGRIGAATALRLGEEGAKVVVTYNNGIQKAEELVAHIKGTGTDAIAVKADISKTEDIKRLVDTTAKNFGRIDIYVDCSGGMQPGHPTDLSALGDEYFFDYIIEVNLKAQFRCASAILPYMQAQQSGSIVFCSSTSKEGIQQGTKYQGLSNRVSYSASKAGVVGMTRIMAYQLAQHHIRVNCVVPGPVNDDFASKTHTLVPLGRWGKGVEVANAILFLASDEASFVTGEDLYVSGGMR